MYVSFLLKDVVVKSSSQFPKIEHVLYDLSFLKANENQFYLSINDVGEFYAENGNLVLINPSPNAKRNAIELHLNGSILGAVLNQRNILALHGSSFSIKNHTVVLCGASGFGKSSISLTLHLEKKATILTDDITPIQNGKIIPISEKIKVWKETLDSLNISSENLTSIHSTMDKYYFPLENRTTERTTPTIFLFGELWDEEEISIEIINGKNRLEYMLKNEYWEALVNSTSVNLETHFSEISEICNSTPMFVIKRPRKMPLKKMSTYLYDFILTQEAP